MTTTTTTTVTTTVSDTTTRYIPPTVPVSTTAGAETTTTTETPTATPCTGDGDCALTDCTPNTECDELCVCDLTGTEGVCKADETVGAECPTVGA